MDRIVGIDAVDGVTPRTLREALGRARDRVDRNADGSLDDIVLFLEPELILRAEEMGDGQWWVAIHYTSKKGEDKSIFIGLYRRGTKRTRWEAVVENEGLVPDDEWCADGHF